MTKRALSLGLLACLVAVSTGCHGFWRGKFLCPFGPGCDPQYCADACGPACGPVCGPTCGPVCDAPCGPDCGPVCAADCGPPCGRCFGPLSWLFAQFRWRGIGGCSGCGEKYWGGYCSDPPDCCDPCDSCGNWTGGGCGCCGGGYPGGGYVTGGQPSGACPNCGPPHPIVTEPSGVISQTDQAVGRIAGTPTPAPRQAWRPVSSTVRR